MQDSQSTSDDRSEMGAWAAAASIFTRDFWTLKALNALFGAFLTIGAGLTQIGIADSLAARMDSEAGIEREASETIRKVDDAVAEFKMFEADALLIQVLTLTGDIHPEVRDQMRSIAITSRRHAFLVILSVLYPEVAAFTAMKDEYDRLATGAIAWDKADADALIAFESEKIQAAHGLQQTLIGQMYDAADHCRAARHIQDGGNEHPAWRSSSRIDRQSARGSSFRPAARRRVEIIRSDECLLHSTQRAAHLR